VATELGETAVTRSGAKRWGGHAWRRGGVRWYAGAGVDNLDIKRMARHSSSAIEGYLAGCDVVALQTSYLRARGVRPATQATLPTMVQRAAISTLAHETVDLSEVTLIHAGVLHRLGCDKRFTACGWFWVASRRATPLQEPPEDGRWCTRCVAETASASSTTSSTTGS